GRDTAEHEGNIWVGSGMGNINTRLTLSGNHEGRYGFRADLVFVYSTDKSNLWNGANHNSIDLRLGDFGNIWLRPTDWARISIGRFFNASQIGRVDAHWLSAWTVGMFGANNIFSAHFSGNIGVLAAFTPSEIKAFDFLQNLDGLTLYVFVPQLGMGFDSHAPDFGWLPCGMLTPGGGSLNSDDPDSNRHRTLRVLQRTWLTAGYRINDEMHARMQFIGANPSGSINWNTGSEPTDVYRYRVTVNAPRIEAAFAFNTERLPIFHRFGIDFGVKTWLPISNWITDDWNQGPDGGYLRTGDGTYWGGIGFGFGASASLTENIRINLRADGDMLRRWSGQYRGVETTITNPARFSVHLWPAYTLNNGMVVMAAAGLNYVGRNTVDVGGDNPNEDSIYWERSNRVRFGGGLSLAIPLFERGSMNVGLAYRHGTADTHGGEPRTFTIPVSFSMSF
ncbi:MAG: hypothetical protein FWC97_08005, partial [Treponema sp.]|nr:hypothetical protein [Treponema sp.]